jgi:hypothetical protein
MSNPNELIREEVRQEHERQSVKERAMAFQKDLQRLCQDYNLAIRGQIPEGILTVYDVDVLRERGAHARYQSEAFSTIDVSLF